MTDAPEITADTAMFSFYDIESLTNAFTLAEYTPKQSRLRLFCLFPLNSEFNTTINNMEYRQYLTNQIIQKNPALPNNTVIEIWNLNDQYANMLLGRDYGLSSADSPTRGYAGINDLTVPSDWDHLYQGEHRFVCDTDDHYDPVHQHPYLVGYNSNQYDTTMLALYLSEAMEGLRASTTLDANTAATLEARVDARQGINRSVRGFTPVDPKVLRDYNDDLFTEEFKKYMPSYLYRGHNLANTVRRNFITSGRHLDVARFNEAQQHVALKRLAGMLGLQIMESDKLKTAVIENIDEMTDLLVYNVSDIVLLKQVFDHPLYSVNFNTKLSMMRKYPEVIYHKKSTAYEPLIHPSAVRANRLTPDSTSAKFVSNVLCPYGHLDDIPGVSFLYPAKQIAEARGIPQVDVLEESRKFFYEKFQSDELRKEFDEKVYTYYDTLRGMNFNDSTEYAERYAQHEPQIVGYHDDPKTGQTVPTYDIKPEQLQRVKNGDRVLRLKTDVPRQPNSIFYFDAQGKRTSCFINFSTGGIHGAQINEAVLKRESDAVAKAQQLYDDAREQFADPLDLRKAKYFTDTVTGEQISWNKVLSSKTRVTEGKAFWRERPEDFKIFTTPTKNLNKGHYNTELNTKLGYTSIDAVIHEDFSSYYPNLLRNMAAFYNPHLGEDRYAEQFELKEHYGKLMKDPTIPKEEREKYAIQRTGTKLSLNSASGAGDTMRFTSIRMNNTIISMRLIGQLLMWRIGQAQALHGAEIISTNTDGIYSARLEETINNRVLDEESQKIYIDIEPEPMILVSKDSNNRLELKPMTMDDSFDPFDPTDDVLSASGSSLSCWADPSPGNSLAHPAAIDYGLVTYLRAIATGYTPEHRQSPLSITEPLDEHFATEVLTRLLHHPDRAHALRMFQNVLAASNSSITYPFAVEALIDDGKQYLMRHPRTDQLMLIPDPEDVSRRFPQALHHYTRVFAVKQDTPKAKNLMNAGAYAVSDAMRASRQKKNLKSINDDPVAAEILRINGYTRSITFGSDANQRLTQLPQDQDLAVRKISGWDMDTPSLIENGDLALMGEERQMQIIQAIDIPTYVRMMKNTYEKNWMNQS